MTKRKTRPLEEHWHHLFHGELTDAPGRCEIWDEYVRYLGDSRWVHLTRSTDFLGTSHAPDVRQRMSTKGMVRWAIDRDSEDIESARMEQVCREWDAGGDDDESDADADEADTWERVERLRGIAVQAGATYCVKLLDGWKNRTWPPIKRRREKALKVLRVVGTTRRGIWIRIYHDVYSVETNLGPAYMYQPVDGHARVVMKTAGSMDQGSLVKLSQQILKEVAAQGPSSIGH